LEKKYGGYTLQDFFVSVAVGVLLILFNTVYVYDSLVSGTVSEHAVFAGVFTNLVLFFILLSPWLAKKAEGIGNEEIKNFLDIPTANEPLKFSAFSGFLSDQALGSFLGTLLIATGKSALEQYGPVVSGFYVAILYTASILLVSLSFIRFISFFARYHWVLYMVAALLSAAIMFSFYQFGLEMAG